ncbi:MAG: helix-turn-helix domain-containing protein [Planctomycetia bacterium]|nr:helix-turn-helix domain-containing protein [Planctomycetia bacterium]
MTLVQNRMLSLKDYFATKNKDWNSELTQIADEQARLAELGLTLENVKTGMPLTSVTAEGTEPLPETPPPTLLPQLRTAQQLAQTLGISAGRISGWRRQGLPSYHLGSRVLYDPAKVQEFIQNGQQS